MPIIAPIFRTVRRMMQKTIHKTLDIIVISISLRTIDSFNLS